MDPQASTLNPETSTLNPKLSTLDPAPSTPNPRVPPSTRLLGDDDVGTLPGPNGQMQALGFTLRLWVYTPSSGESYGSEDGNLYYVGVIEGPGSSIYIYIHR